MKKFNFPLAKVLRYREQLLEAKKNELRKINSELLDLKLKKQKILEEYDQKQEVFLKDAIGGMLVTEYRKCQEYMWSLLKESERLLKMIVEMERRKASQLKRVIQANQDVLILEKLRDKSFKEYNKKAIKQEERAIEEFVSSQRSS